MGASDVLAECVDGLGAQHISEWYPAVEDRRQIQIEYPGCDSGTKPDPDGNRVLGQ
jgi:hypothetical protein